MHSFFRPTAEILADVAARQAAEAARFARIDAEIELESDAHLAEALAPLDARVAAAGETDEELLARMLATTDPTQFARACAGLLPNPTAAAVPAIVVDGRSF